MQGYEDVKGVLPEVIIPKWKQVIENVMAKKKVKVETFGVALPEHNEVREIELEEKRAAGDRWVEQK